MSSVWLVVSGFNSPIIEEGFHVTQAAARARAREKAREDQATYDASRQWLEISFDEFRAIRGLPASYEVLEVEDVEYEIHRDGLVPDAVWLLIEEGEVDYERGYRVTRESAEGLLLSRDIAAHEYWGYSTERHDEGQSFVEYHRVGWNNRIVRIERYDMRSITERPSRVALDLKERIMGDSLIPEPMMSVRDGLTTYTWNGEAGTVVELRAGDRGSVSTTVHRANQRPCVTTHRDDVVMRARGALEVSRKPLDEEIVRVSDFYLDV